MNDSYDSTEYVKYLEAKKNLDKSTNRMKSVFRAHEFFMDVKLTDCDPCKFCDNTRIDFEKKDTTKCADCLDHTFWIYYALTKLSFYENTKSKPVIENKPVDDSKKCMFCNTPGGRPVKLLSGTEGILCNDCLDEMFHHYH